MKIEYPLKRFIQDDVKALTDELAKRETMLRRMENTQSENQYVMHELSGMKKRLLSFEEYAKGAQPEVLFTLLHTVIDRVYITTEGSTIYQGLRHGGLFRPLRRSRLHNGKHRRY
ncbi:MAG: hypothetical protein LBJ12_03845 [Oscillospiraceae bacterium]|nr:hypothetical protein [Oscillospiraceae bacterium]